MAAVCATAKKAGKVQNATFPNRTVVLQTVPTTVSASEAAASASRAGKERRAASETAKTPPAQITEPVSAVSAIARLAGKGTSATSWTSKCTSACRAVPITEFTILRLPNANVIATGPDRIALKVI